MEAETLKKKKVKLSKGKLKKTMKNVLCRPDPIYWPELSELHSASIEEILKKYRVNIPQYTKPLWAELKSIPKNQRPKPPKIQRVDGLIFGISTCSRMINSGVCSAILIEAEINPRIIVQHVIEACTSKNVPYLCLKQLKKLSEEFFGFPTSCLGIQNKLLPDICNQITKIANEYIQPINHTVNKEIGIISNEITATMEVDKDIKAKEEIQLLYRTSKSSRVFNPQGQSPKEQVNKFVGQDFIEFSKTMNAKTNSKSFMKMIVKKISNNPNRIKKT